MKKNFFSILLLSLIFLPFGLIAQESPIDAIIDKYGDEDGFTTIVITSEMFSLFSTIEVDDENNDFANLVEDLSSIKIITFDNESKSKNAKLDFYQSLMKDLPAQNYTELMSVKEKDQNVKFFIRKLESGKIGEMIMVSGGDEDNTLISITGQIDLNDMSKLSHSLGIKGLENLKDVELQEDELEMHKEELKKAQAEIEQARKEIEEQKKELEKQMKELEEEKRK